MNPYARDRYLGDAVTTGSPQTLLVRLYDRLVVDLEGAEAAIGEQRLDRANELIGHAQDIITELRVTLKVDLWDGGPGLAQLYDYCYTELVEANLAKDADKVAIVRGLLAPLRDAWKQAALELAAADSAPTTAGVYASA